MISIIDSFVEVTDKNFNNKVLNNPLPVVVIFEKSFWGAAKIMKQILKRFTTTYAGKIEIYRYDMDKNSIAAGFYHLQDRMAIIVFNKSKVVNQTGVISFTKLQEIIEPLINDHVNH